jgi:transcriptional regulator with XRE-family HTH domain
MLRGPPLAFPSDVDFAQRLSNLRQQQRLTQQALADLADLHVTLIRRYEAGKTSPASTLSDASLSL